MPKIDCLSKNTSCRLMEKSEYIFVLMLYDYNILA